jgi:hypothetical protein
MGNRVGQEIEKLWSLLVLSLVDVNECRRCKCVSDCRDKGGAITCLVSSCDRVLRVGTPRKTGAYHVYLFNHIYVPILHSFRNQ